MVRALCGVALQRLSLMVGLVCFRGSIILYACSNWHSLATVASYACNRLLARPLTVPPVRPGSHVCRTHEWQVPPANEKFVQQEAVIQRRLGISGASAGRTSTPRQQGVYNPILNTWTVLPSNPRLIDGLSFVPATTFSRPTPATIRM